MLRKKMIIAIDGPAGSGKSTLAKELAKKLGYLYVDTGAMYRAVTWKAIQKKVDLKNDKKLQEIAENTQIELKPEKKGIQVFADGRNISDEIRTPLISNQAPAVARVKGVRACMVVHQRHIGSKGGVVLEGRDIGTVVFPNADIKFYIQASLEERAKRRLLEMHEKGIELTLEKIKRDLKLRDHQDQSRETAPLKPAENAFIIDSTSLSIEEKTELALKQIQLLCEEK